MTFKTKLHAYIELGKPRIMGLVLVTAALGYYLGGQGIQSWFVLFVLLAGTASVCSGSSILNHYVERDVDAKMDRTRNRPIPSGKVEPFHALMMGAVFVGLGVFLLYQINVLTSFLGLLTSFLYVSVYTPLKKVHWLNTSVGAFPGAIPTLGGWSAATGSLSFDAGILFLILFLWQHPHFYAIAWMFREDYKKGGLKMLPCIDPTGQRTFHQSFYFTLLLIFVALIPALRGHTGVIYAVGISVAGVWMLAIAYRLMKQPSRNEARGLLRATVVYLPVLLILIVFDSKF